MVDILKITTPVPNKTALPATKQVNEAGLPFDLQEIAKITKTTNQGDIHKQNSTLTQRDTATILSSLLKNPSVTVSFLKNIYMLQEIIKLLPVNNQTTIQELRSLFDSLLISPHEIVGELVRQKNSSTMFKGELFDFLRGLISENDSEPMTEGVVRLLRAINANINRHDVLDSIANNLKFLGDIMGQSKNLSASIKEVEALFRREEAPEQFNALKVQIFEIIKDIQGSVLFTDQIEKVVSILEYNLSRFNSNKEFFRDSVHTILSFIDGKENKNRFIQIIENYIASLEAVDAKENDSKIMNVLAEIIGKQAENADIKMLSSDTIERIVHSLLSSPCNFTPLLHLVIPVQFFDIKSFAEVWIDPNAKGDKTSVDGDGQNIHMLLVFDIEGIGSFEMEIFVRNKGINLVLMCPKAYMEEFQAIEGKFSGIIAASGYRSEEILINQLERPRSLMDVFKSLPYKRTGVDVRV